MNTIAPPRPLDGVLVVELARGLRAAYCGKLLAEQGATVVKVEPLAERAELADGERIWLDAGKQSVVLDWRKESGSGLLRRLIARADVLVEDQEPDALVAAGLTSERLRAENSRLVHTTVTDFGSSGPWARRPATDLIVSALAGMAALNNFAGAAPLREPGDQTSVLAALFGYLGTLTALINRQVTGAGQRVDIAALEAVASVLTPQFLGASYQGVPVGQREPGKEMLWPCKDGWLSLMPNPDRAWQTLIDLFGLEADPADPRFASEPARRRHAPLVRERILPVLAERTRAELFEQLSTMRVVCGMVLRPDELVADPHLAARGSFLRYPLPGAAHGTGALSLPGPGFRLAGEPPAPLSPLTAIEHDIDALLIGAGRHDAQCVYRQEVLR